MYSRRRFMELLIALGAVPLAARRGRGQGPSWRQSDHPDPRPGIDASRVLSSEFLSDYPAVADIYEGIRRIPEIADGIRCRCGCAESAGMRSLLTCYESNGMALSCLICQSEGRAVARWHDAGRTLDEIRDAVDARFGNGAQPHHSH